MEIEINNIANLVIQEAHTISNIPDVVLWNMLRYADASSLLNLRSTSRKCQHLANSVLRKSPVPVVNFEESLELLYSNFVADFSSYLPGFLPFTNFSLYIEDIGPIQSFLTSVGPHIRNCTLEVSHYCKSDLLAYVQHMPNLKTLFVKGRGMRSREFTLQGPTANTLPKLATLQLMEFGDRGYEISLEVLNAWIRHMPSLRILRVRCTLQVNNQLDYLEFINEHSRLTEISFTVKFLDEMLFDKVHWPVLCVSPNLKYSAYIRNRNGPLTAALRSHFSHVTDKVSLRLEQCQNVGNMPKLEHISFRGGGILELEQFLERNNLENFYALHTVYLNFFHVDEREGFREMTFSNVKSLHICHGFNRVGGPSVPYHFIFPQVTALTIEDHVFSEKVISYLCEYWRKVEKLKLLAIAPYNFKFHELLFRKEKLEIRNEKQKTLETNFGWSLSCLEDLKELHILDPLNMKSVIVNIAILTRKGIMPRLDHILLSGDTIAAERMLLKQCKWHKKIEFKQKTAY